MQVASFSYTHARRGLMSCAWGHNAQVDYAALLKKYLAQGLDLQAALERLRNEGASPLEAIAAIAHATGVEHEEARGAFALSRAWDRPRVADADRAPATSSGDEGQHGRSGHGASSVLPHLLRQPPSQSR